MSRVKFNVNTEYAYLQNFKILQSNRLSLSPGKCLSLTKDQTVSPNTRLTAPSPWKPSSNAKCKTTSNFFSGLSATGISTSLEATTTPSLAEKLPELPHPLPHLQQQHALQASVPAQRGEALHPQQVLEARDPADQVLGARRWSMRTIS